MTTRERQKERKEEAAPVEKTKPTMVDLLAFSRRLNALSQAARECGQFVLDLNYDRDTVATILRGQIDFVMLQLEGRPDTQGATPP
jgi:hypothetical protein